MIHLYDELSPLVDSIAAEFGRKFHQYGADNVDYAQELWAWVYGNLHTVEDRLESTERKDADRYLAKCLRNAAKDYTEDLKAQVLGYSRDDLYYYSINEVKALLPIVFDKEKWLEPPQSEGRSTKAPAEGGNWMATLADVAQAIEKLDLYDKSLLRAFHKDGWSNKMMAEAEGVSEQSMSYYHHRAVKKLTNLLGGPEPTPRNSEGGPFRGRRAMSNSAARAETDAGYDE